MAVAQLRGLGQGQRAAGAQQPRAHLLVVLLPRAMGQHRVHEAVCRGRAQQLAQYALGQQLFLQVPGRADLRQQLRKRQHAGRQVVHLDEREVALLPGFAQEEIGHHRIARQGRQAGCEHRGFIKGDRDKPDVRVAAQPCRPARKQHKGVTPAEGRLALRQRHPGPVLQADQQAVFRGQDFPLSPDRQPGGPCPSLYGALKHGLSSFIRRSPLPKRTPS